MESAISFIHFGDVHLGVETHGRTNPSTGRNTRLDDVLGSLDYIVDRVLGDRVDLVLIGGDIFHRENPHPTEETEFAKRIKRMVEGGAEVVIVLGNHDYPSASGRAAAVEIFPALDLNRVHVVKSPEKIVLPVKGTKVQVLCMPWVRKSAVLSGEERKTLTAEEVGRRAEELIAGYVKMLTEDVDPSLPALFLGHIALREASASGVERSTLDTEDPKIPVSLIAKEHITYVGLGHIHRFQNLNPKGSPPVVYSGSIERMDFSEEHEEKGFVIGEIYKEGSRWKCRFQFVPTPARKFRTIEMRGGEEGFDALFKALQVEEPKGAIVRVRCRVMDMEEGIDEKRIREALSSAFSVRIERIFEATERDTRQRGITRELDPIVALRKYIEAKPELRGISEDMIRYAELLMSSASGEDEGLRFTEAPEPQ
jgi:exonuclease SbcD